MRRLSTIVLCLAVSLASMTNLQAANAAYENNNWGPGHGDVCDDQSPAAKKEHEYIKTHKRYSGVNEVYTRLARGVVKETIPNGIIIALSKDSLHKIGAKSLSYRQYLSEYSADKSAYPEAVRARNRFLKQTFDSYKFQYVSHIFAFKNSESDALYNIYNPDESRKLERSQGYYADAMAEMERAFTGYVRNELQQGGYTHVLVMAMGWHNDQRVSLCRYREIAARTAKGAAERKMPFKPFIIGFTWPSSWYQSVGNPIVETFGYFASIFNKATDADEVGYLWGNLVINRLLPQANRRHLPVVAIGHSFGTRIVTKAIFGREILKGGGIGHGPELLIDLQPAQSIYRYMPGKGAEGYPFAPVADLKTKIIITSSKSDEANPFAVWSKYAGSGYAIKIARNDKSGVFDFVVARRDKENIDVPSGKGERSMLFVDASAFIWDHNDILSDNTGAFIAEVIRQYAPYRGQH